MNKLAAVCCAALMLAGCATVQKLAGTAPPSLRDVYLLESAYDAAFLVPATEYERLGQCKTGSKSTLQAPCFDKTIVAKLQLADNDVKIALGNLKAFVVANPGDLGVSGLYSAAQAAVATAEQIAAENGIK